MMHPHCVQDFVIRLKALRIQINPIDSCQCSNELGAQLNLTNDPKRRVTIPASMACAWNPHVAIVSRKKCSSNIEKGGCCRGFKLCNVNPKKMVRPVTTASCFNIHDLIS
jgi:hypothetical protein